MDYKIWVDNSDDFATTTATPIIRTIVSQSITLFSMHLIQSFLMFPSASWHTIGDMFLDIFIFGDIFPAVYMSYKSQNFLCFTYFRCYIFNGSLFVLNFRIFLLLYPSSSSQFSGCVECVIYAALPPAPTERVVPSQRAARWL